MNLLQKSARAWKEIIEYRYLFVYGYKKQLYPINLIFSLNEYPHLAGFQYAKDIALPNYSSAKIADRVIEGKISFDTLKKATQYKDMIKPRLEALIHLKESLDNEFNLYSFMPRMYPFYTTIKADYLISSHTNINNFIFIINHRMNRNVIFFVVQLLKKENVIMKPINVPEHYSKKNVFTFLLILLLYFLIKLINVYIKISTIYKAIISSYIVEILL